jgi:phage anti-repressor protein
MSQQQSNPAEGNALIPIQLQEIEGVQTEVVSARELHQFLGVGRDFSNWVKDRISTYQFVENQDFVVFAKFGENPKGGRPATEYALTLDTAKELAMLENNEKGKQIRRYFIDREKDFRSMMAAGIKKFKKQSELSRKMNDLMDALEYGGTVEYMAKHGVSQSLVDKATLDKYLTPAQLDLLETALSRYYSTKGVKDDMVEVFMRFLAQHPPRQMRRFIYDLTRRHKMGGDVLLDALFDFFDEVDSTMIQNRLEL